MFGFKNKSPQDRIRIADKSTQKLRDKRSKLDSSDEKKAMKINKKIHRNNVEIKIANQELHQPKTEIYNSSKSVSFNKNDNSKHLHGHLHINSKKNK